MAKSRKNTGRHIMMESVAYEMIKKEGYDEGVLTKGQGSVFGRMTGKKEAASPYGDAASPLLEYFNFPISMGNFHPQFHAGEFPQEKAIPVPPQVDPAGPRVGPVRVRLLPVEGQNLI